MLRIEQCSIRAKISLHEPQNLQNLFVVTREIDNMGDVGSEVRLHFYKETIHWNAGRRGTVWYSKAPAVSGAIPMTHITQYFHDHPGSVGKVAGAPSHLGRIMSPWRPVALQHFSTMGQQVPRHHFGRAW